MPSVFVRNNNTWTEVADPLRIYARRTHKVGAVDVTEWDPVSSLYLREGGVWQEPRTWSPPTPEDLQVPSNKRNEYTTTTLTWNASSGAASYNVRQNQWKSDASAIEATATRNTTALTMSVPAYPSTFYSYEVQAVGANGLVSDFCDPYRYKTGKDQVLVQVADYGWSGEYSGVTNWPTNSNVGAWDNAYHAYRATNNQGWNEGSWGWIIPNSSLTRCDWAEYIAPGRLDWYGARPAYPYNPTLQMFPGKRVKINYFQIGHVCAMGWKYIYPGWYAYSRGHQGYAFHHMRADGSTVGSFFDGGVDGNWPGHADWMHQTAAWNQPTAVVAQIHGDLGEYIRVYLTEYPPVVLGTDTNDYQIPYSVGNIRFLWFWWNEWVQTGSHPNQISPPVAGTNW